MARPLMRMPQSASGAGRPGPGGPPGGPGAPVEHAENVRSTLVRMWRYFSAEKLLMLAIGVAVTVGVVCGLVAPNAQARAIDIMAGSAQGDFFIALVAMLVAYLAYSLCQFAESFVSAHLSQRIVARLRKELFGRVMDLPIGYLDKHMHGDLMSRMTNDIESISNTVSKALPTLFAGSFTIVGTAAVMLFTCWQLALVSFASVALTVVASRFLASRMRKYSRARQALLGQVNGLVEENMSGVRTVVANNYQAKAKAEFLQTSDNLTKAGIKAEAYAGTMGPVMNLINNLNFVVVAAFGGWFAMQGITTIGVISAFIIYVKQFGRPINELAQIYGQLQTAVACAERVFGILDQAAEDMSGQPFEVGEKALVEFDHVDFSYEPGVPVLHDFCLKVPAGQKVALVGATGSGKTTVVNLLERFYDVDAGRILVNGADIATLDKAQLRRQMAIVLQTTTLLTDTVRANLSYANPDATEEQLRAALEMSTCAELVAGLPQGLDTVLDGGGAALSQGQRQLLAIARAFVANPRILILDEATSSVDTRTEKAIQDAMQRVMENRTSIVIAHRLSTIQDADLIVVMDQGRIVEQGTHDQLLAYEGVYHQLYMTQFAGFDT